MPAGVDEGGEGALPRAQPGRGVEERGPAAGRDEAEAEAAETETTGGQTEG